MIECLGVQRPRDGTTRPTKLTRASSLMAAPMPRYRVIYNWDGAPHGYGAPPQSMESFLEATFKPVADTHCDGSFDPINAPTGLTPQQSGASSGSI